MYLLLGLSSLFSQNSQAFLKKVVTFVVLWKKLIILTKNILFDCYDVRFSFYFLKKPNFQNTEKSRENRTNMEIILLILENPPDKHSIAPVHITYQPLSELLGSKGGCPLIAEITRRQFLQ